MWGRFGLDGFGSGRIVACRGPRPRKKRGTTQLPRKTANRRSRSEWPSAPELPFGWGSGVIRGAGRKAQSSGVPVRFKGDYSRRGGSGPTRGETQRRPKHVVTVPSPSPDAGSIPAASTTFQHMYTELAVIGRLRHSRGNAELYWSQALLTPLEPSRMMPSVDRQQYK